MAITSRAVCTVHRNDVVEVGGRRRLVAAVRTDHCAPEAPRLVLRFRDGGPVLRVHPAARLDLARTA
ncbi:hypothetical protein ACIHFE_30155 [Streptomyces sp. NPDC052396]|uniref:hypothetical protein n=1 Tax=Streptomyces sp. NPDC052396 TaxID=3365689 RepID=UPI0037D15576